MSSDRQGQRRPSPGFGMMPDGHSPDTPHSGTIPIAAGRTARRDLVSLDAEGAMRETRGSIARSQESLARSSGYLGRNRAFTSSGMSLPPEDTGIETPEADKSDPREGEALARFDAETAAEVLHKFAQIAWERFENSPMLEPSEPIVVAGALLLRDAKLWLDQHLTPYDCFAGDAVLDAHAKESAVHVENFVSALRSTAIELIQVRKLLEYRMHSTRRPWI